MIMTSKSASPPTAFATTSNLVGWLALTRPRPGPHATARLPSNMETENGLPALEKTTTLGSFTMHAMMNNWLFDPKDKIQRQ